MNGPFPRALARTHCLALVLAVLASAGCADASAQAPAACGKTAALAMPSGVSVGRIKLLDEGKFFKVYTSVEAADDKDSDKRAMPASGIPNGADISNGALNRELADVMLRSKRFVVLEMRAGVTAEQSDVLVTARILDISQKLVPLEGGRRVSASNVRLSVQVKNMYTGENLLTSDAQVEGRTGMTNGDRVLLTAADDINSPRVQRMLADDLKLAVFRAFEKADERIEGLLRPMARVEGTGDACGVDLFGGSRNGLQRNDDLVVFRTTKKILGETTVLTNTRAIAQIHCTGVGDDVSQCTIVNSVAGQVPQEGDYAVVNEDSMQRVREQ